jgi:hypothetical protein
MTFGLFVGMLLFLEIGRRIAASRIKKTRKLPGRVPAQLMVRSSPCSDYASPSPSLERVRDSTRGGS